MTVDKRTKQLARMRQAITGESYQTARNWVVTQLSTSTRVAVRTQLETELAKLDPGEVPQ